MNNLNRIQKLGNRQLSPAHRSNPDLAPEERFWCPFFVRPKKIILIKRRGKSMEQKLLEIVQVTKLCFILVNLFLLGSKTETGVKTAHQVPKLGTSTGGCQNLVPGWHSQRRGRGPAWSVICSNRHLERNLVGWTKHYNNTSWNLHLL